MKLEGQTCDVPAIRMSRPPHKQNARPARITCLAKLSCDTPLIKMVLESSDSLIDMSGKRLTIVSELSQVIAVYPVANL